MTSFVGLFPDGEMASAGVVEAYKGNDLTMEWDNKKGLFSESLLGDCCIKLQVYANR